VRRLALRIDQLPVWAFLASAIVLFGAARAGRLYALLHGSRGGMELGAIVSLAAFLCIVIFAVRRRQIVAWRATIHVLSATIAGNALGIVFIWPFIPDGYAVALGPLLTDTVAAGIVMAVMSLPLAIALLWLSRRFGSHSAVTERRLRVVREHLRRRFGGGAGDGGGGA
jgi:hypothetical protein